VGLVTEGLLRLLHRKVSSEPNPYGLPIPHRTFTSRDASTLPPGEVAELVFDLMPISYLFRKGHRVRLAVSAGDGGQFEPRPRRGMTLTLHRSRDRPSRLELPIIGAPR